MRLATPIAIVVALALLAGCGDSGDDTTGSASTDRTEASAKEVRAAFLAEPRCRRPRGASRWGCSIDSYRCQGVVTARGWSISCSQPGRSVAFVLRR
jgi:type IV pilus biogenesis protein CpaD/CtpE